jgi:cell division septum initiation protein DivIVA
MEDLVESSKSLPLTKSRIVDYDAFFVLSTRLKGSLPEDIKKAEKLAREGQQVVVTARAEAQRTVTEAQNESQRVLGDSRSQSERIVAEARTRADRVLEDARREAERIIADAQQHAEQLVADHAITSRAQQAADQMEQAAVQESQHLREQADDYAFDILDRAETVMRKLVIGLEHGKAQLNPPQQHVNYAEEHSYGTGQEMNEGENT